MSFTDRLFQKTDVRRFYGRYTKLRKRSGKDECIGLCPLHEEKTPSFSVNIETGSFYCFGCREGGGPVQFEAKRLGISAKEASKRLAAEFGLNGNSRKAAKPQRRRKAGKGSVPTPDSRSPTPSASDSPSPLTTDNRQLTTILQALLDAGRPLDDKAVAFFARRKIQPETLDRFQIGFLMQPAKVAQQLIEKFSSEDLLASGVFRQDKGKLKFQFLNTPLLFPMIQDGKPVYVQGRRTGQRGAKYCNLSKVEVPTVFNIDVLKGLQPGSEVFICEGAPDAMILTQEGFPALGTVGSGTFKPHWAEQLARFKIHLVPDNDGSGQLGAERTRDLFHKQDMAVHFVELPEGVKDANEYFLERSADDFRRLVQKARQEEPDFQVVAQALLKRVADRNDDFGYLQLSRRIFRRFCNSGGGFFRDDNDQGWLLYRDRIYPVGHNKRFDALMQQETGIIHAEHHAKVLWAGLENLCINEGKKLGRRSWMHADPDNEALYVHLHGSVQRIARLRAGDVEVLLNGVNDADVLLTPSKWIKAIEFDPEADPERSVRLLKELVVDALALPTSHRWMLLSWILCVFFLQYSQDKALMRLAGHTGSGKSTGARLMSCLVYGHDRVGSSTVAANYSNAAQVPYLICDNLETENRNPALTQFLLLMATGAQRDKRKGGTDSETVSEEAEALVAITAIEPLTRRELLDRFYEVEFQELFKGAAFNQKQHLKRLVQARSQILSGVFRLFARDVLPGMERRTEQALSRLQTDFAGHSKRRLDTFLSLMIVILQALLGVLYGRDEARQGAWRLLSEWLEAQAKSSAESARAANAALFLLDALSREMAVRGDDFEAEYYLCCSRQVNELGRTSEVAFEASAKQLLRAFQILSRKKGVAQPFVNAQQLGVRMAGEKKMIDEAGWEWGPSRVLHGIQMYSFRREME